MQIVYAKIQYDLIDTTPNFFAKLKRYVGLFRVEAQDIHDYLNGVMTVSFYTNKVEIKDGESALVHLEAKRNKRGSWYFTNIIKISA
jgi:hypothetical protein